MNQSSFIAAALLAGFVLYVAAKGRLTTYTAVLWGPTNASLPPFLGIPLLTVGAAAGTSGVGEAPKPSPSSDTPMQSLENFNPGSSFDALGSELGSVLGLGEATDGIAGLLEFLG